MASRVDAVSRVVQLVASVAELAADFMVAEASMAQLAAVSMAAVVASTAAVAAAPTVVVAADTGKFTRFATA